MVRICLVITINRNSWIRLYSTDYPECSAHSLNTFSKDKGRRKTKGMSVVKA